MRSNRGNRTEHERGTYHLFNNYGSVDKAGQGVVPLREKQTGFYFAPRQTWLQTLTSPIIPLQVLIRERRGLLQIAKAGISFSLLVILSAR